MKCKNERIIKQLERGNVTESVLIFPLFLGLIFAIIQIALWAHANNIAQHSAHEAANASSAYRSTASPEEIANNILKKNASGFLNNYSTSSTKTDTLISVTVRGESISLVPFVKLPPIERTATSPIEKFGQ